MKEQSDAPSPRDQTSGRRAWQSCRTVRMDMSPSRRPPLGRSSSPALVPAPWSKGRRGHVHVPVLAGSTLGLAGVGAALVLALGGSAAPPAFAITTSGDGSVLVQFNTAQSLPQANHKLTAMGIHEQITIYMASGPATVSGPVDLYTGAGCRPVGAAGEGSRGRERHGGHRPGQTGGNTGVGTCHLDRCAVTGDTGSGNTGSRATRAPVDPVTAADARPARASAMARSAVRPPADGGGRTAAWWPWLLVAAAVGWNLRASGRSRSGSRT